jgi:hypothetical protein
MIKNITKNALLSQNIKHCSSFFSKCKGLMFSKKLTDNALLFHFPSEKRHSLHMLFVFYPIDVLWLNQNRKVVEMKQSFKPFTFATPKKPAKFIIELPENTIKNSKTEIGDSVEF